MSRRAWKLAVSVAVSVLPGCLGAGSGPLPAELFAGVNGLRRDAPVASSPYDPRRTPPGGEDEPADARDPRVERATEGPPATTSPKTKPEDPPPPPGPKEPEKSAEDHKPARPPSVASPTEVESPAPAPRVEPRSEGPVADALRCFLDNRADDGLDRLRKLDPPARDLLAVLLPLAVRLEKSKLADARPRELASVLDQLDHLIEVLRPRAALRLEKMCFCRAIEQFGVYEPLPSGHAYQVGLEGQPGDLVQVYVELRNFTSRSQGELYETVLATSLELRDYQGALVWQVGRPARLERSRSRRQDCFLNCHFYVPAKLPTGDYVLTVRVKDLTGAAGSEVPPHRVASRTLDLHVRPHGTAQVQR